MDRLLFFGLGLGLHHHMPAATGGALPPAGLADGGGEVSFRAAPDHLIAGAGASGQDPMIFLLYEGQVIHLFSPFFCIGRGLGMSAALLPRAVYN